MLCAGYLPGGKGICEGDSGGPLVCNDGDRWWQHGISSFVVTPVDDPTCALKGIPPIFTNVASLSAWVQEKTGGQCLP